MSLTQPPVTDTESHDDATASYAHRIAVLGEFINKIRRARGDIPFGDKTLLNTVDSYDNLLYDIPTEAFENCGLGSLLEQVTAAGFYSAGQILDVWRSTVGHSQQNARTREYLASVEQEYRQEPTGRGREMLRQYLKQRGYKLDTL